MNKISGQYNKILNNFTNWANTRQDIQGAIIIGSQARNDHPADEWSDLDLWIITVNPDIYLTTTNWIENIGKPLITFQEAVLGGSGRERRVLFTDGLDVDFAIDTPEQLDKSIQDVTMIDIIRRGINIIIDKDGTIAQKLNNLPGLTFYQPPSEAEFLELVNIFWFRAQWAAKRLRRGELWIGKRSCDATMKELLLKIIEWHERCSNGWDYDTWHRGSFLEEWVSPEITDKLRNAYARYNIDEAWIALRETTNLFRLLSMESAKSLKYKYPSIVDENVSKLIKNISSGNINGLTSAQVGRG